MTQNITIKNPSPKLLQFLDAMRKKNHQQMKKLAEKKKATVTIIV